MSTTLDFTIDAFSIGPPHERNLGRWTAKTLILQLALQEVGQSTNNVFTSSDFVSNACIWSVELILFGWALHWVRA